eukprot:TRINITY_DN267_c0_g1_i1.p1 TRINITY_DN267_c0_g1~~TRINITY_DN267_c0_g1_i1.p1  ORF type:complete len:187 (-),score=53.30 TRINITY_DN267_c0_g1_i1:53-613(-)
MLYRTIARSLRKDVTLKFKTNRLSLFGATTTTTTISVDNIKYNSSKNIFDFNEKKALVTSSKNINFCRYWEERYDTSKKKYYYFNNETEEIKYKLEPNEEYMPYGSQESTLIRFLKTDSLTDKPPKPWQYISYWVMFGLCSLYITYYYFYVYSVKDDDKENKKKKKRRRRRRKPEEEEEENQKQDI